MNEALMRQAAGLLQVGRFAEASQCYQQILRANPRHFEALFSLGMIHVNNAQFEEGQRILAGRDFVPTSRKVDTPLNKIPMKFVDARIALDEFQKWEKLYAELFTKGAR